MKTKQSDLQKLQSLASLPHIKLSDSNIDKLEERVDFFFEFCAENQVIPTVNALAIALSCSRQNLWATEKRDTETGHLIQQSKQLVLANLEQMQLQGTINPRLAIWEEKNCYGYTESVDIQGLENRPDADMIARRFTSSGTDADARLENQINSDLGINDKGKSKNA